MLDIVIIDDDRVSTFVTEQYIKKSLTVPYKIHTFSSAVGVSDQVAHINPEFLFLDLVMPQMTGWDFLEEIKGAGITSQVYILSGSLEWSDVEKANNNSLVKKFLPKLSVKECIPEIFRN
ncbi:response regulator [uncultured Cyclobacterium sp.]|uniref:response regulator n=1 Tax=uncultured Cyclobacterium sp. TaxID=453820 RepID=UPI0030EF47BF|tara:strand:+ start:252572 stop:252931 length:360 start_codon:yes stop_codon:yes gene_type:complete